MYGLLLTLTPQSPPHLVENPGVRAAGWEVFPHP